MSIEQIKIIILTLEMQKDRQRYIANQLESMGLEYNFFWGINGNELTQAEINNIYDKNKSIKYLKRTLTKGEIGCAQSHKLIYKKMIEENIESAIILEDDVQIKEDFIIINTLKRMKLDNYIIKLERPCTGRETKDLFYTPWRQIKLIGEYKIVSPLSSVFSTCAYYIDKLAAQSMLNTNPKIFLPADFWDYFRRFIKLRILNRDIVNVPELFDSIIEPERKTALTNKKNNKFYFLKGVINIIRRLLFSK
jgi:GR25 family glycosyltransferase involved in LPS biosynthesis